MSMYLSPQERPSPPVKSYRYPPSGIIFLLGLVLGAVVGTVLTLVFLTVW